MNEKLYDLHRTGTSRHTLVRQVAASAEADGGDQQICTVKCSEGSASSAREISASTRCLDGVDGDTDANDDRDCAKAQKCISFWLGCIPEQIDRYIGQHRSQQDRDKHALQVSASPDQRV
ncbi:hypothetical protein LX88_007725 [Lentzea californiensis]|nr:hypothetical protein [Lentzea californiensis]